MPLFLVTASFLRCAALPLSCASNQFLANGAEDPWRRREGNPRRTASLILSVAPGQLAQQIYETTGGSFDTSTNPAPNTVAVGSGTVAFQSCSSATLSYTFTGGSSSGKSGTIALSRVGPVPPGCTQ